MAYKWQALIAVCFGTYMATMDFSIVNVALPTLSEEFDRSASTVVWATLASSLVVTGLTLTAGRTGDLYGRKRVYITGWVIFTIGMGLAGFAQSIEQLIAIRFLQSVGVALAIANGNAIVTDAFPDSERGQALGLVGSVVGAGLMSGPILGGAILSLAGWEAIFLFRVPIGLISMAMALLFIRESEAVPGEQRKLDIPGALLVFGTLSTTLLAVNRGLNWGWTSAPILGLFAVGAVSLVLLIRVEMRSSSPVISPALFRVRSFAASIASLMLNFAGQSAVIFLMPFYLIEVRDFSTAQTGLIIATVPAMMFLLSPISGYVADRWGYRYQTTLGLLLVTIGLLSMTTLGQETPVWLVMARLAVVGVGTSIFMSPNSSMIMGSVPRRMLGTASASVATSRNVGNAMGLAMASTVLVVVASHVSGFQDVPPDDFPAGALLDGIQVAFLSAACVSSLAIGASLFQRSRSVGAASVPLAPAQAGASQE